MVANFSIGCSLGYFSTDPWQLLWRLSMVWLAGLCLEVPVQFCMWNNWYIYWQKKTLWIAARRYSRSTSGRIWWIKHPVNQLIHHMAKLLCKQSRNGPSLSRLHGTFSNNRTGTTAIGFHEYFAGWWSKWWVGVTEEYTCHSLSFWWNLQKEGRIWPIYNPTKETSQLCYGCVTANCSSSILGTFVIHPDSTVMESGLYVGFKVM